MIIRSLYLGASSVLRIYQNKKLIWNTDEPIALISRVAISSDGKATLVVPVLFELYGEGESTPNAMGIGRRLLLVGLVGDSDSNTYTISQVVPANALVVSSDALSASYTDTFARLFDAVSANSAVEGTTDTSCVVTLFYIKPMVSEVEGFSDTEAWAKVHPLVNFGLTEAPSNTHTLGVCYSWWFVSALAQSESKTEALAEAHALDSSPMGAEDIYLITYSDATANSLPFYDVNGFSITNTFGNAEAGALPSEIVATIGEIISKVFGNNRTLPAISSNAIAESISDGLSNGRPLPAMIRDGKCEITVDGVGNIVLLYLPVWENNVLKIPSAYEARVVDGVLEVI